MSQPPSPDSPATVPTGRTLFELADRNHRVRPARASSRGVQRARELADRRTIAPLLADVYLTRLRARAERFNRTRSQPVAGRLRGDMVTRTNNRAARRALLRDPAVRALCRHARALSLTTADVVRYAVQLADRHADTAAWELSAPAPIQS